MLSSLFTSCLYVETFLWMCLTFFIIKIKERLKKIVSPLYIQRKKNIAPKMLLTFIHSVNITRVWSRGWNASKQQNRQFSKSLYSIEGIMRNTISIQYIRWWHLLQRKTKQQRRIWAVCTGEVLQCKRKANHMKRYMQWSIQHYSQ